MKLSIGVGRYDRTQALLDGRVQIKGHDAVVECPPLEELFARAFDTGEFDVAELSFSNYLYLTAEGKCNYVGLPLFPSRMFRHSAFFVRDDRGIRGPRDLAGRRVGVREYSMTAALVARGVLSDEYGVKSSDIEWVCGPADAYDAPPIIRMQPRGVKMDVLPKGKNLSDMLRDGELDAVVAYKPPKCFSEGAPNVRRLFPDHVKVEQDYYARTGIFPIMHLMAVRRDLAGDAGLLGAVCDAFEASRAKAIEQLSQYQALPVALPWAPSVMREVTGLMGADYWPYGVERNRGAIESIARYSHEQGLASRVLGAQDLFAQASLGWKPAG